MPRLAWVSVTRARACHREAPLGCGHLLELRVDEGKGLARSIDQEGKTHEEHADHDAGECVGEVEAERAGAPQASRAPCSPLPT